jgi:hypothetical protein
MFRRILYPTDGSAASMQGLQVITHLETPEMMKRIEKLD